MFHHCPENPFLFIRIHFNIDGPKEKYRWSFIVGPAKGDTDPNGQKYWIGWHLEPFGDRVVCRFLARQNDLRETGYLLVHLIIAEVKDLTRLDRVVCSRPSADATEHPNSRSLFWVKELLGRLVGEGCLKETPNSFEEIETEGRELAQRSIQLRETIYVSSQSAWIGKEVEAAGKGKETPSSIGPPNKPTSSMAPPLLPASATQGKRNKHANQAARMEAPAQGPKFFTMDDLPIWPQPKLV